jgi:hypothetical protein
MYNFWSGIWILQKLQIKFIKYSNCAKSNISQEKKIEKLIFSTSNSSIFRFEIWDKDSSKKYKDPMGFFLKKRKSKKKSYI